MVTQATATAVKRLALWYRREGFIAQCERLFRVAICMQEREVGPQHIAVAISLYQLGEVYADLDKYDIAEQYYRRASEIYESQEKTAKRVQTGGFSTFASPSRNSSSQDACLMTAS